MSSPIRKIINKYIAEYDIGSITNLSKITGLNRQTLYERINNPTTFRIYEIRALDDELHFSDEDMLKLIKGE